MLIMTAETMVSEKTQKRLLVQNEFLCLGYTERCLVLHLYAIEVRPIHAEPMTLQWDNPTEKRGGNPYPRD